jgi:hypothetical protein
VTIKDDNSVRQQDDVVRDSERRVEEKNAREKSTIKETAEINKNREEEYNLLEVSAKVDGRSERQQEHNEEMNTPHPWYKLDYHHVEEVLEETTVDLGSTTIGFTTPQTGQEANSIKNSIKATQRVDGTLRTERIG